jgi:hypothetical protein
MRPPYCVSICPYVSYVFRFYLYRVVSNENTRLILPELVVYFKLSDCGRDRTRESLG